MARAIAERQNAEDDQRRDLDHVNGKIDRCGGPRALDAIQATKKGEDHGNQRHEDRSGIGAAHDVWIEKTNHIADKDAGDATMTPG